MKKTNFVASSFSRTAFAPPAAAGGAPLTAPSGPRPKGRTPCGLRTSFEKRKQQDLVSNRVALVMDWLTTVGGAEKVLLKLHRMYPEAPIYTSQYDPEGISWFRNADVRTGWMQKFPAGLRRFLGVFRAKYFASLDLSDYDVVISVTGAEAKVVKTKKKGALGPGSEGFLAKKCGKKAKSGNFDEKTEIFDNKSGARHISYCHAPTQYYWGKYEEYLKEPGFGVLNPVVRLGLKLLVGPLKRKDYAAAQKVDQFVTISEYEKGEIQKYYGKEAEVVWPGVEVDEFRKRTQGERGNFFVTTSRQVTWKRLDLAVKACGRTHSSLVLIGDGAEHENLVKMAGKYGEKVASAADFWRIFAEKQGFWGENGQNSDEKGGNLGEKDKNSGKNGDFSDENDDFAIYFLPRMEKAELKEFLWRAKGFLFPSEEPFGIAPVEALAGGCPVIAFSRGGSRDFIRDGENGVFFDKQSVSALSEAISRFDKMKFDEKKMAKTAEKFSEAEFERKMREIVGF